MSIIEKTVFISSRIINFSWAMSIYQYLTNRGYDVFLDYFSIPSGSFEQVITENIRSRANFLVILTPSALDIKYETRKDDWFKKEIAIAIKYRRNIVPIQLEGFDFGSPNAVRFFFGEIATLPDYQALRLIEDYFDEGMERLCNHYLNKPLKDVLHPISDSVRDLTEAQQQAAIVAPYVTREKLSAQVWFERGYKATNPEEKIRCYTETILLDTMFSYAYVNRGNAYAVLGQHEHAIQDYDKAIQIDPENAIIYCNRGQGYAALGQHKRAIQDCDKAIEINPEDADTYYTRGNAYAALGQHERAIQDFDKAILINPKYTKTYYNRGNRYVALGQHERAISDYDKAIQLKPEYVEVYVNRGSIYSDIGQHERAIQDYDKAIEINPELVEAYNNRGTSYAALNQHERAIQDFDKTIEINPELAEAYINRGLSYADLEQHERALADYDKAISINPEYAAAYYNKACSYGLQGKADEGVVWLKEALERKKEHYCELASSDADFDPIRNSPAFIALMDEFCSQA